MEQCAFSELDGSLTQNGKLRSLLKILSLSRLLPDSPRFGVQAQDFSTLNVGVGGVGIVSVYRTNGKSIRVPHALGVRAGKKDFFYQAGEKMDQTLSP